MPATGVDLTRAQILAFRQLAGALTGRLPPGRRSLRVAAWAGLQDSMPRAALLSIHARVQATTPAAWEDPSLVQLWGPRYSVFVVAARDLPVFSLGTMPDHARGRARAADLAARLHAVLGGARLPYGSAGDALGLRNANLLKYAAATGTVLIRWEGARQPVVWTVPPPALSVAEARLELARRFLHIFGPGTAASFTQWSGAGPKTATSVFEALRAELTPVRTPLGAEWILSADEAEFRAAGQTAAGGSAAGDAAAGTVGAVRARLLPSGDAYLLHQGVNRDLLVPDTRQRDALWTPRVWPGGVLVGGEIAGTWRRASTVVTISPWRPLSAAERDAVAAEAESLPLPGVRGQLTVRFEP